MDSYVYTKDIEDLIEKWKDIADGLKKESMNGTGDLYREFRRSEMEILNGCIAQLQEVLNG
jgi:hypothetical protein